eukprot:6489590-Alexandrium_andersonii.AAC.1
MGDIRRDALQCARERRKRETARRHFFHSNRAAPRVLVVLGHAAHLDRRSPQHPDAATAHVPQVRVGASLAALEGRGWPIE